MKDEILNEKLNYVFDPVELNNIILPLLESKEYNKIRSIISSKSDRTNDEIYQLRTSKSINGLSHKSMNTLIHISQTYDQLEDYFINKLENIEENDRTRIQRST